MRYLRPLGNPDIAQKSMEPAGREMDVFVLSLSPGSVQQRLEDAWMEEALVELGLSDLVPHA